MTIDEKLEHFYSVAVEAAKSDAEKAIEEHKANLAKMYEEHEAAGRANAELVVKAETENVRREVNKVLSTEQIHLKKEWSEKQETLKESLFSEIKKKIEAFKETPEYEDYLVRRVKEVVDFAGEDEVKIFLSEEDGGRRDTIEDKSGVKLLIAEESFGGGIRAEIPAKNILIDNSFNENLSNMRKEFKFDGGLSHE